MLAMISVSWGYGTQGSKTPTTVAARESPAPSRTFLPRTDGSLFKAVDQNRYVNTTAPAAFGPSSLASSSRPSIGRSPITWKYDPPTTPARNGARFSQPHQREPNHREIAENVQRSHARSQILNFQDGPRRVAAVCALPDVDEPAFVAVHQRS